MNEADQKKLGRLAKAWHNAQAAYQYHWAEPDDGHKSSQALTAQKRNAAAFEKAGAAWKALEEFSQQLLRNR